MNVADQGKLSFAKDIRPLFTDTDVAHMKPAGMDLSNRDDVQLHADAIYRAVSDGAMPPPGSGKTWTADMCERFKRWQNEGCPP
jgi:tyrosinase